jgi:pilus assembly protein FimV
VALPKPSASPHRIFASLRLLRFSSRSAQRPAVPQGHQRRPINEPFVDVLIEVTWPAGRIQREYPILLDPPGFAQSRVAPQGAAPAPPRKPPRRRPPRRRLRLLRPRRPRPGSPPARLAVRPRRARLARAGSRPRRHARGETYGPSQKGETLRKIAGEVKPDGVSMEQMLVALYRENQAAFAGNNMNRLKTGQILKVPKAEDANKIAQKEANTEIRTQVADWKSYRDQLAGGVAPSRARRIVERRFRPCRQRRGAPARAGPVRRQGTAQALQVGCRQGWLRIGQGRRPGARQRPPGRSDRQGQGAKESQSRVTELEKQIRDMQRLLDLKGGAARPSRATSPRPRTRPRRRLPKRRRWSRQSGARQGRAAEARAGEGRGRQGRTRKPADASKARFRAAARREETAEAAKPAEPPKVARRRSLLAKDATKPTTPPKKPRRRLRPAS